MVIIRTKKLEKLKHPWVAAFFNFTVPGAGYIFAWGFKFYRKVLLGIILMTAQFLLWKT